MRIGTVVNFNDIGTVGRKLGTLKDSGFETCQLVSWNPAVWTDENAQILKGLLETYGIMPSAFWCGWEGPAVWNFTEGPLTLGLVPPEYRKRRIRNLCDGADFAAKLGISYVATHMGFIPENPSDPNFLPLCIAIRTVAEHLAKNGQKLLFETGQETPVAMLRCFETVGCDNLGVNLDTANLVLYGKANPADAVDVIGRYVLELHAKDGMYPVNGRELGRETRIGEGSVDFRAVFTKLRAAGFDGCVTIEREIEEGSAAQLQDIRNAKTYLEKVIAEVYGPDPADGGLYGG